MAGAIAKLAMQISANAASTFAAMDRVKDRARQMARSVESTKARVDVDTRAAHRQLDTLEAKAKKGFKLQGALNPVQLANSLISGSIMRAITASKEGKEFMAQLDRTTSAVIAPLLRTLTPAIERLVPVAEVLGDAITELAEWVGQLTSLIPQSSSTLPPGQNMFTNPNTFFGGLIADNLPGLAAAAAEWEAAQQAAAQTAASVNSWLQNLGRLAESRDRLQSSLLSQFEQARGVSSFDSQLREFEEAFQAHIAPFQQGIQAAADAPIWLPPFLTEALQGAGEGLLADIQNEHTLQMQKLQAMRTELSLLRQMNEMRNRAAAISESLRSPMSVFQSAVLEAQSLGRRGLLAQADVEGRIFQAFEAFRAGGGFGAQAGPAFLEEGSVAAQAAINAFQRQGGSSVQEQIRNLLEQDAQLQQRQLDQQREVVRALQALGAIAPARLARP